MALCRWMTQQGSALCSTTSPTAAIPSSRLWCATGKTFINPTPLWFRFQADYPLHHLHQN